MSEQFWRRLSYIAGIMAIGVVFGLTAFMASLEIKDLDLWLHLKMGQYITEHKTVPAYDVLSCTVSGKPWINHEWLFQVFIYQVYQVWGFDGLIQMQVTVVFITFLLLLLMGYNKDRQFLTAFGLLMVLYVYVTRFTIRPDIFSLLFFVSFFWILSWFIHRRWSTWALVVIQVLWSNMHGFFFFGPLMVIIAVFSEFIKRRVPLPWQWNEVGRLHDDEYLRLKKLVPLILGACFINPLTFKGALYPLAILFGMGAGHSNVFFAHITELQKPFTLATFWTEQYGYYKALIVLSGISFIFNRRQIDISTIFIWIVTLLFSMMAVRNIVFFSMAGYLILMNNLISIKWQDIIPFQFSDNRFKYITGIACKVLLILWMMDCGIKVSVNGYFDFDTYERKSDFWGVSKRVYPYRSVDFLVKNQIKGNFFNDFNSGAYLIGRCYPNIKVFMDGRTEEYGSEFFEHYLKIWREGDKDVFLADAAKFNVTGAFLNNTNQQVPKKVLKMFYSMPDWKLVYFDADAVIFLKNIPANKQWIDRYSFDLKKWQAKPMDLLRLGTKRVDPWPFTSRAYLLETLGLYDAVLSEVTEALKISPDDFESFRYLGKIYASKGDHRKAFESFRIACLLKPYDSDTRLLLAQEYVDLKDYKGAIGQYQRILEVEPKNIKGSFGISKACALDGQLQLALQYLNQAKSFAPEDKVDVKLINDIIEKSKKLRKAHTSLIDRPLKLKNEKNVVYKLKPVTKE